MGGNVMEPPIEAIVVDGIHIPGEIIARNSLRVEPLGDKTRVDLTLYVDSYSAICPEPPREVGSHWRHPDTRGEYIRDEDGDYYCYRHAPGSPSCETLYARRDSHVIARLVPLDTP